MTGFFRRDRGPVLVLLLLCLVAYLPGIHARDFWEPEEPEFALLVRTMAERGDWIVPWQNGRWYAEKPPLVYWTSLVTSGDGAAFRASVAAERALPRLPALLAGTALVLGLYLFARGPWGRRAGFLAGACLATCGEFIWRSTYLQTDMLFASATAGAVMAFLAADRHRGPRPKGSLLVLGWFLLALSVLAKGPLGPVLAGAALLAHVAMAGRKGALRALSAPAHLAGLVVFAATALPWYFLVHTRLGAAEGGEFLRENLILQNFGRTLESHSHRQTPWYYLEALPSGLMPWTPVVLVAVAVLLRAAWRERGADREGVPAGPMVAAWFLPGFLLLSAVSSKQGKYLLPLYPPLALAAGIWLDGAASANPLRRSTRAPLGLSAGLLLVAGLAASLGPLLPLGLPPERAVVLTAAVPGGIVLALGSAVVLVRLFLHAAPARAAADLAATVALSMGLLFARVLPAVDPLKSARTFCGRVAATLGPDDEVSQYGSFRSQYTYFLHRDTPSFPIEVGEVDDLPPEERKSVRRAAVEAASGDLLARLEKPGRTLVITQKDYFEKWITQELRDRLAPEPLVEMDVGGDTMVLVAER